MGSDKARFEYENGAFHLSRWLSTSYSDSLVDIYQKRHFRTYLKANMVVLTKS